MTDYLKLAESWIEAAQHNLEMDGELQSFVMLLTEKGLIPIVSNADTESEKEMFVEAVRQMARKHKAEAIFYITEGWYRQYKKDENIPSWLRIRDMPESKECVIFILETQNQNYMAKADVKVVDGKRTFEIPRLEEGSMGGIFSNLLGK